VVGRAGADSSPGGAGFDFSGACWAPVGAAAAFGGSFFAVGALGVGAAGSACALLSGSLGACIGTSALIGWPLRLTGRKLDGSDAEAPLPENWLVGQLIFKGD
jgi:hypothetical protein